MEKWAAPILDDTGSSSYNHSRRRLWPRPPEEPLGNRSELSTARIPGRETFFSRAVADDGELNRSDIGKAVTATCREAPRTSK